MVTTNNGGQAKGMNDMTIFIAIVDSISICFLSFAAYSCICSVIRWGLFPIDIYALFYKVIRLYKGYTLLLIILLFLANAFCCYIKMIHRGKILVFGGNKTIIVNMLVIISLLLSIGAWFEGLISV